MYRAYSEQGPPQAQQNEYGEQCDSCVNTHSNERITSHLIECHGTGQFSHAALKSGYCASQCPHIDAAPSFLKDDLLRPDLHQQQAL